MASTSDQSLANALCRRLGIRYPVFGLAHSIEVAAAISNAGGLGVYAAARDGPNELAQKLQLPAPRLQELLKVMVAEGGIVRVSDELHFDAGALAGLRERLVAYLREKKEISTQAFKEMVAQSRKFVIPLSEYFDREKVTLRVGEKRTLRRG